MNQPPPIPAKGLNPSELLARWGDSLRQLNSGKRKWRRSTLTAVVALQMRPYLEALIADPGKPVIIPFKAFPRNNPHTIYQKWLDTLKWYIEIDQMADPMFKQACIVVKALCHAQKMEDHWLITPATSYRKVVQGKHVADVEKVEGIRNGIPPWKEDFVDWVQISPAGDVFLRKGLCLSNDEINFVTRICLDQEWAHRVSITEIRVVKGE